MSYDKADVIIIAFSIVSRTSFDNVKIKWYDEDYKKNMTSSTQVTPPFLQFFFFTCFSQIILIGTKKDLIDDKEALDALKKAANDPTAQPVTEEEGIKLARQIKAFGYYQTSARTGSGVHEAFAAATAALHTKRKTSLGVKGHLRKLSCSSPSPVDP